MSLTKINSIVFPDSTITETLTVINTTHRRLATVICKDSGFLGVVSDGDIRRALLAGKSMECTIDEIYNKNSFFVSESQSNSEIINILLSNSISHIPLVNDKNRYVKMLSIYELLKKKRDNTVVIMAGGLGSRLKPITDSTPKPMIEIDGKPLLEIILKKFIESGFVKFVFCINYKADMIINHFSDGSQFGVSIEYTHEKKRMGTAGALLLAKDKVSENFLVINGDVLTNFNFNNLVKFQADSNSDCVICTKSHDVPVPYGVVQSQGSDFIGILEKPVYSYNISAGVYMMNRRILKYIPADRFYDMPELIESIKNKYKVSTFPISEYWADIGTMKDLLTARSS